MKRITIALFTLLAFEKVNGQTNTFPPSGNVGIGTTAPTTKLHIMNGTDVPTQIAFSNSMQEWRLGVHNGYAEGFNLYNATLGTTNFLVTTGGNMGVGTTTPNTKLHISNSSDIPTQIAFSNSMQEWRLGVHSGYAEGFNLYNATSGTTDFLVTTLGNVGIGTTSPSEKLSVNGNILAKKLRITQTGWSDYVFDKNYELRSLSSLETYINQNKHLPEVPTAKEVEAKGTCVGDTQALLLKKIEELTLYLIAINKKNEKLEKKNEVLCRRVEILEHK